MDKVLDKVLDTFGAGANGGYVAPLQGLDFLMSCDPGRCPGLVCHAPPGLVRMVVGC